MAGPSVRDRHRILLVAEAATFAHVARISKLKQALHTEFETETAFDPRFDSLLTEDERHHRPLWTIPSSQFMATVNQSRFPYTEQDIATYVKHDLQLLTETQPTLVIGDFRISLALSCSMAKVPYLNLVNGYWSESCREPAIPPHIGLFKILPKPLSSAVFALGKSVAFRLAARPFNRVANSLGLTQLSGDLSQVYTQGDVTLLAEPDGWLDLFPSEKVAPIGPVSWAPDLPLPDWWNTIDRGRPLIYVSLGSSGDQSQIGKVLEALCDMDVQVVVAGKMVPSNPMGRARVFSGGFINSQLALEHAHLFVSNGGSLSLADALRSGCPVVGIASNYDQVLSMAVAERHGVGEIHFDDVSVARLKASFARWLDRSSTQEAALAKAKAMFSRDLDRQRLSQVIHSTLSARQH